MKSSIYRSTRKGVASIYVVIFATILFGVITLSFIRIILSESSQSGNDDLSQSAYDSALAGVEDAKIAVNKYYQCISQGGDLTTCKFADLFDTDTNGDGMADGDCENFKLKRYLNYDYEGEVKIQESESNNSDQAYTCVILSNVVPDYRSTLTSDTRTRVVPIGIGATKLSEVKYIEFSWYSELNGTAFKNLDHGGALNNSQNAPTPPTISLTLLKTPASFSLNDFNNSTSGDYSTMILLPSQDASAIKSIQQNTISRAGDSDKRNDAGTPVANSPFQIKCEYSDFACTVTLGTSSSPLSFTDGGNAMLVISLPYGDTITDFAVTLKNARNERIPFENVQVSVDSTGRANQLLRRVETRLDPADIFFPYPQYEVELTGGNDDSLLKNFWITANCWTENGTCHNNGNL